MENEEKTYQKAFNNGYLLAQHHPQPLSQLTTSLDRNNPYCDGLLAGKEQHDIEKAKSYFKKFERSNPSEAISKDKSKNDKGIDYGR